MLRKLPVLCILMMLLTVASVSAQKNLQKANKQFELRAFDLAVQNYHKTLQSNPDNVDAMLGLAESYRMMKDHLTSIKWFEQVIQRDTDMNPKYLLNYAHTLKSVGLYDQARNIYLEYRSTDPVVGEHFAESCDFAKRTLEETENYKISLYGANTAASDFGIAFFKDKVVYASFGKFGVNSNEPKSFSHIEKSGNQLLMAPAWTTGSTETARTLRSPLREQYGIGPLSYSPEGKLVAYTRNNFSNGNHQIFSDETDLSIYTALVDENGDFYEEKAFPYNETEYATAFAQLTHDGKTMYFSSNKPGGFGGFDVYVSYFKKGNWTSPENLGESVNSNGNEITPFYDGEVLYFSSDYHQGLGGFDVFKSELIAGQWSYPENLGNAANSPADDYYFSKNINTGEMYLSSNRLGGRGADDIYLLNEIQNFDFADFTEPRTDVEMQMEPKIVTIAHKENLQKEETSAEFDSFLEDAFEEENIKVDDVLASDKHEVMAERDNETISEANTAKKVLASYNSEVSLAGAKKVAIESIEELDRNATVFFVQVAALTKKTPNIKRYSSLLKYGNIYKFQIANSTKIRVGYYFERAEANEILRQVRKIGFADAFIAATVLDPAEMELVASNFDVNNAKESSAPTVKEVKPVSKYKVRLASYADPLWFNVESVKDMGEIEQWTKGNWTIFVLSGFATKAEAEKTLNKAVVRGFVDAELVMDEGGVLTKIKK